MDQSLVKYEPASLVKYEFTSPTKAMRNAIVERKTDQVLVIYEEMLNAIAKCYHIDEVKDVRDQAVACAAYAKQAQNFEAERMATEIRVRAERRCGELLIEMEENGQRKSRGGDGSNQYEQKSNDETIAPTLEELGLTRAQSSAWQQLARIPQAKFESVIQLALVGEKRPTAAYIIEKSKPEGSPEWWEEHWKGMPEFGQEDQIPPRTFHVHCQSQEDVEDFVKLVGPHFVGQKIGPKTQTLWYPKKPEIMRVKHLAWVDTDPEPALADEDDAIEIIDEGGELSEASNGAPTDQDFAAENRETMDAA